MDAIRILFRGLTYAPRAIALLLRDRSVRRLAVWPAIISVLALVLFVVLSVRYGGWLLDLVWTAPDEGGWQAVSLRGLHVVAQVLLTAVLVAVSGALFFFGSALAAEPFLDPLSEAAERAAGAHVPHHPFSLRRVIRETAALLRDVVLDLGLFAVMQLAVLLLLLIPGVGAVVHMVVAWVVNSMFAAIEMTTGPLVRRELRGRRRWRVVRAEAPRLLSLGSTILALLMIPLAQLATLPVAVVAGALAVVDMEQEGRLASGAATQSH